MLNSILIKKLIKILIDFYNFELFDAIFKGLESTIFFTKYVKE